ncbi:DUF2812 domain-containing protein [Alkalihalobacillus sp. FSL W8-0930]
MKTTKYIMSEGLAFGEETDMKKLQLKSKEGWHLEKFAFMGYTLKKGEPAEYIYNIDYRELADEEKDEYLNLFTEAGWTHVLSSQGMHFFRAAPGTKPIYTDMGTIAEKHHNLGKSLLPITIITLLLTIFSWVGITFSTGMLRNILAVAIVPLTVVSVPAAWTVLTIYKNKWGVEGKKGLILIAKVIPYLLLLIYLTIVFLISNHVHDGLLTISRMVVGAAGGFLIVYIVIKVIEIRVNKA